MVFGGRQQTDIRGCRWAGRQADRQTVGQLDEQMCWQVERKADKQEDRQRGRLTDREAY